MCCKGSQVLVPKSTTEITVSASPGICLVLNMIGVLSILGAFTLFMLAWKATADATGVVALFFAAIPHFALSHLCKQSHLQTAQLTRQTLFLARIAEKIDDRIR